MKQLFKFTIPLVVAAFITACGQRETVAVTDVSNNIVPKNSIYHWKTVFEIDSTEMNFLKRHDIERIYLRMFDVVTEYDFLNGTKEIVPIATTRFVSPVPENIEIVPVTYITIDALRAMSGREEEMAGLIVERLLAMSSYNRCGKITEVQLDCDWTSTTQDSYSKLCQAAKDLLHSNDIELSITVRLHQLGETPPPADRGVLMLYNTGALKDPNTFNSILDIDDVKPYMETEKYPLQLDYAYPVFSWGVKFKDNKFVSIVSYDDCNISGNEHIRNEMVSGGKILDVKKLVEECLGKPARGNILYHLDYSQLKKYSDDEISEIFSF